MKIKLYIIKYLYRNFKNVKNIRLCGCIDNCFCSSSHFYTKELKGISIQEYIDKLNK